jgi:hypothetical protein
MTPPARDAPAARGRAGPAGAPRAATARAPRPSGAVAALAEVGIDDGRAG